MSTHKVRLMSSCAMLLLVGAAGRSAGQAVAVSLPGTVVDVQAAEFFFVAPDTIAAGLTTFRLLQTGMMASRLKQGLTGRALVADKGDNTRGFHMLWVVRLDSGKTVGDLRRAAQAGDRETGWVHQMGGAASMLPPLMSNVTMDLPPGRYALVCYVGSAREDRSRYHLLHGMARSLTVVATSAPRPPAPKVDVHATIDGDGVVTLAAPVREGRVVIRVQNRTERNAEFRFMRVPDGVTAAAFLSQPQGAEPGVSAGGLSMVPPGRSLITTIDVTRGEYIVGTQSARHATSRVVTVSARR